MGKMFAVDVSRTYLFNVKSTLRMNNKTWIWQKKEQFSQFEERESLNTPDEIKYWVSVLFR